MLELYDGEMLLKKKNEVIIWKKGWKNVIGLEVKKEW